MLVSGIGADSVGALVSSTQGENYAHANHPYKSSSILQFFSVKNAWVLCTGANANAVSLLRSTFLAQNAPMKWNVMKWNEIKWNEMKVQWFQVRSKTDLEPAKSNTPWRQIQPLSRIKHYMVRESIESVRYHLAAGLPEILAVAGRRGENEETEGVREGSGRMERRQIKRKWGTYASF